MTRDQVMQLSGEALWREVIRWAKADARGLWLELEGHYATDHWRSLGAIFRYVRVWAEDEQRAYDKRLGEVLAARVTNLEVEWIHDLDPADAARALLLMKAGTA